MFENFNPLVYFSKMSSTINQLQLLQQNLQNILLQKQQLQNQQAEINSALEGLMNTEKAYKILGNIMIAFPKEKLLHDLEDQNKMAALRLKNVMVHEEKIKKSIQELQKEVVTELGKKNE